MSDDAPTAEDYEAAIEKLMEAVRERPEETPDRDTYADGYTSGLIAALWLVRSPQLEFLRKARERAAR